MNAASVVNAFIARARRRIIVIAALQGATIALVPASLASFALAQRVTSTQSNVIVLLAAAVGALIAGVIAARRNASSEIERHAPESRNIIFTAAEVLADDSRQKPYVKELVATQAGAVVARLDPASMFPAGRASLALVAAIAMWGAVVAMRSPAVRSSVPFIPTALGAAADGFEVLITPPAYTGRKTVRHTNPTRVEAFAGSRIRIAPSAGGAQVSTSEGELRSVEPNVFETVAAADGFIAVQSASAPRRLVGLTVTPDLPPRVKVDAPGKDLFIADAKRRIPVEIEARDDIGLTSLRLRYTKVSGSGERFTFIEGEIPIAIQRVNAGEWTAKGTLDLGALNLVQGDMVVYRGAATDGRPNPPVAESDAFIVEITSPLMVAAEGFSQDDQMDKYALSQQMVILKTERLLARASTMSPESLTYHSQLIAAEQRSVRAEFVFMMGGEVAEEVIAAAGADLNEEAEAANESELAAGRMVNRGRVALVDAIRRMSRASTKLNEASPATALPDEKAALVSLQEAFSRTRYLLRALTQRERLDLSRRLTGVLSLAARDARSAAAPPENAQIVALRRALAGIAALAGTDSAAPEQLRAAADVAQEVLQVDPSDTTLQRVASRVQEGAKSLRDRKLPEAHGRFDDAATLLTSALQARLPREDAAIESPEVRKLRAALSEARRKGAPR